MKQALRHMICVILVVTAAACGLPSTEKTYTTTKPESDDGTASLESRLAAGESVEFGEDTTISAERFDGASFRNMRIVIRDAHGVVSREFAAERGELRVTKDESEMVLTLHEVRSVMGPLITSSEIIITRPLS